jgi:hypothetical protein
MKRAVTESKNDDTDQQREKYSNNAAPNNTR